MLVGGQGRTLVFDVEANGFLMQATKMWCIAAIDFNTNEVFLFHDYPQFDNADGTDDLGKPYKLPPRNGSLKQGALFLNKAKQLICHNVLGFDIPLIQRFYPKFRTRYDYSEVRDTLLESQVQWYDRRPVKGYKGVHGLAVWGARLGIRKPEIEDWSYIDADKLNRCIEDVKINVLVAKNLEEEREKLKYKCGIEFINALKTEHEYRYRCTQQEMNGALVNRQHMEDCVEELDNLMEELRPEIEPQLPPTFKVKGAKLTKQGLFDRMGINKKVSNTKFTKIVDDREVIQEVKDWFAPVVKWQTSKEQKYYSIVDKETEEELQPCRFEKLKEAREYAKEHYPDIKKFKYPNKVEVIKALDHHTKNHFKDSAEFEIVGEFTKITLEGSTMSQHEKVKLLLVGLGWDTDEWTFKKDSDGNFERAVLGGTVNWPDYKINGKQLEVTYKPGDRIPNTPKITEVSYETLPEGLGSKIGQFNTYSHRRKFIQNPKDDTKGLLNNIREDGRISCGITTFGTTAGRA